jgi:hypothetical protein
MYIAAQADRISTEMHTKMCRILAERTVDAFIDQKKSSL